MDTTQQFHVGQRVDGYDNLKALPVGTRLVRHDSSSADLHWTTNGGEATRSNDDSTFEFVVGGWVEVGWFIDALPSRFEVGQTVTTRAEYEALPVGTVMRYTHSTLRRSKQADNRWQVVGFDGSIPEPSSALDTDGYIIEELPEVEPAPSLIQELADEGPLSPETVRQFKARFRSLALSASHSSGIDMDLVHKYLELGGFSAEDVSLGMLVYGEDEDAFLRLPTGSVLKEEDAVDPSIYVTDETSEPDHIHGPINRTKFLQFRVTHIPGTYSRDHWVEETMGTEEARAAHREIEALKLTIWDLGNKGRDESADAGDRWCSVFEDTLAEVGVDESYARSKGWVPPTRHEEVSVTIEVDGETHDGKDISYAREMVGHTIDLSIKDFEPAKVGWTWKQTIHNVEVEEGHCACGGYEEEPAIKAMLDGADVNYSEFSFTVTCDND